MLTRKLANSAFSAYHDLLFVFSWTAITHFLASALTFVGIMVYGDLKWATIIASHFSYVVFSVTFMQTYAFCQFLVMIITVHQAAEFNGRIR